MGVHPLPVHETREQLRLVAHVTLDFVADANKVKREIAVDGRNDVLNSEVAELEIDSKPGLAKQGDILDRGDSCLVLRFGPRAHPLAGGKDQASGLWIHQPDHRSGESLGVELEKGATFASFSKSIVLVESEKVATMFWSRGV